MNARKEISVAVERNQRVTIKLHGGGVITGVAEVSNDTDRAKVRTNEGPTWVPYEEIEHVSRVINLVH